MDFRLYKIIKPSHIVSILPAKDSGHTVLSLFALEISQGFGAAVGDLGSKRKEQFDSTCNVNTEVQNRQGWGSPKLLSVPLTKFNMD